MGLGCSSLSSGSKIPAPFKRIEDSWTSDDVRELLESYKDLDLDFMLDSATLGLLLKGDDEWAAQIIGAFAHADSPGAINALAFITGISLLVKTSAADASAIVFDAFDFDETQHIHHDEMVIALISASSGAVKVTGRGTEPSDVVIEAMVADAFGTIGRSTSAGWPFGTIWLSAETFM